MSKTCVSGVAGFLGSHLADHLLAEGHSVLGIDNFIGGEAANVPEGADMLFADIAEEPKLADFLGGVDVVYHTACCPHEGLSVFSPVTVTKSVFQATINLATAAIQAGVKRFVNFSSMSRFGKGRTDPNFFDEPCIPFRPFHEDMPAAPVDPYGIAKVAAEQVLNVLGREHGMEVVHIVCHNVYGPRQRYFDPYRNVIGIFVNRLLQGKPPIVYGDGLQERCFSYVDDVIPAIARAGFAPGLDGEVINVGPDDQPVTIRWLALTLCGMMRSDLDPVHIPERPCEVKVAWCSAAKARRLLDYRTRTAISDGLIQTIDWIKQQGPRPFDYHLPLEIVTEKTPRTWAGREM